MRPTQAKGAAYRTAVTCVLIPWFIQLLLTLTLPECVANVLLKVIWKCMETGSFQSTAIKF
jgi:hypothetical protein